MSLQLLCKSDAHKLANYIWNIHIVYTFYSLETSSRPFRSRIAKRSVCKLLIKCFFFVYFLFNFWKFKNQKFRSSTVSLLGHNCIYCSIILSLFHFFFLLAKNQKKKQETSWKISTLKLITKKSNALWIIELWIYHLEKKKRNGTIGFHLFRI